MSTIPDSNKLLNYQIDLIEFINKLKNEKSATDQEIYYVLSTTLIFILRNIMKCSKKEATELFDDFLTKFDDFKLKFPQEIH